MNVMNPDTATTHPETGQTSAAPRPAGSAPALPDEDYVRRGEFRLLLWIGAFALTTVLGGMTFLYTAAMDLQLTMVEGNAELRILIAEENAELRTEIGELKTEMQAEHIAIRSEISSLRE